MNEPPNKPQKEGELSSQEIVELNREMGDLFENVVSEAVEQLMGDDGEASEATQVVTELRAQATSALDGFDDFLSPEFVTEVRAQLVQSLRNLLERATEGGEYLHIHFASELESIRLIDEKHGSALAAGKGEDAEDAVADIVDFFMDIADELDLDIDDVVDRSAWLPTYE